MSAGSGSAATRQPRSRAGSRGRTTNQKTRRSTREQRHSVGPSHACSASMSVTSSWAMWIHHSWGSLTNTQITAATDDPEPQAVRGPGPSAAGSPRSDEEVLERVREDQQQRAPAAQLERHHADEPVEVQEPRHPHGRPAGPVPHRRQVRDRQVVDVHGLVVALVLGRVVAERLEDRLVDAVEHQRRQDGGQREARDQQRYEEPRAHHRHEHDRRLGIHTRPFTARP